MDGNSELMRGGENDDQRETPGNRAAVIWLLLACEIAILLGAGVARSDVCPYEFRIRLSFVLVWAGK